MLYRVILILPIRQIAVEYLSKLYCVCVIWTSRDIDEISLQNTTFLTDQSMSVNSDQLVWLNVGIDQEDVDAKVRLGLDVGCQVMNVNMSIVMDEFWAMNFAGIHSHFIGGIDFSSILR